MEVTVTSTPETETSSSLQIYCMRGSKAPILDYYTMDEAKEILAYQAREKRKAKLDAICEKAIPFVYALGLIAASMLYQLATSEVKQYILTVPFALFMLFKGKEVMR